ncbi:hypothetical protein B296_00056704 [Ensete ventricosum]|uniref:Uncharacterized protein n=1 Tax=Ensete ventricosum TaxID=4639 RepID=A0A426X6G1_ENSVE|nr:hypothetical protein B296_00056704 [Ensete ventricosum]
MPTARRGGTTTSIAELVARTEEGNSMQGKQGLREIATTSPFLLGHQWKWGKGEEQGAVEGDVDGQWEAVATLLCIGGEKGSSSNVKAAQLSGWQVVDEGGGSSGRRRRQRKAKGEVEEVAASARGGTNGGCGCDCCDIREVIARLGGQQLVLLRTRAGDAAR